MDNAVILVSFSSRNGGNCEQICDFIAKNHGNSVGIYRFADFNIHPCGGCQYECFLDGTQCPHYDDMEVPLLQAISAASEVYFVVPNYCNHPCANFYIFNERSNCWFQKHPQRLDKYLQVRKKFIAVSTERCDSFEAAFCQHVEDAPEILYISAKHYGAVSSLQNILQFDQAKTALLEFLKRQS